MIRQSGADCLPSVSDNLDAAAFLYTQGANDLAVGDGEGVASQQPRPDPFDVSARYATGRSRDVPALEGVQADAKMGIRMIHNSERAPDLYADSQFLTGLT